MTDLATRAPAEGFLPLDGWEHPPRRPPSPNAAPVLTVNGFEGPLDWLVDLVRTRQIDLARLSITALIEAFEEALTAALAVSDRAPTALGRWSGWLVMAAELTLLRSRLLVSVDATAAQEAQDAAEQLRQRRRTIPGSGSAVLERVRRGRTHPDDADVDRRRRGCVGGFPAEGAARYAGAGSAVPGRSGGDLPGRIGVGSGGVPRGSAAGAVAGDPGQDTGTGAYRCSRCLSLNVACDRARVPRTSIACSYFTRESSKHLGRECDRPEEQSLEGA